MQDQSPPRKENRKGSRERNFLAQLSECTTVKQFKEKILAMVSQLGFSDFTFTVLNTPSTRCITTLPDRVRQQYQKYNLFECDLFLEHAEGSSAPIFQSEIENYITLCPFSSERLERNKKQFKLLANLGYHDGYCIPHTSHINTHKAILSIFSRGSSKDEFRRKIEQFEIVIPFLAEAIAYFGFGMFSGHFLDKSFAAEPSITPKPLKLLTILAKDGLTLKESAVKLCISVDTANKHVAAAKQSLGATTLANAVYLAMLHGLMEEGEEGEEEKQKNSNVAIRDA